MTKLSLLSMAYYTSSYTSSIRVSSASGVSIGGYHYYSTSSTTSGTTIAMDDLFDQAVQPEEEKEAETGSLKDWLDTFGGKNDVKD